MKKPCWIFRAINATNSEFKKLKYQFSIRTRNIRIFIEWLNTEADIGLKYVGNWLLIVLASLMVVILALMVILAILVLVGFIPAVILHGPQVLSQVLTYGDTGPTIRVGIDGAITTAIIMSIGGTGWICKKVITPWFSKNLLIARIWSEHEKHIKRGGVKP